MFGRKTNINTNWKTLTDQSQFNEIDKQSIDKPVVIFKHSTTCGISAGAHHRLDQNWDTISDQVNVYYLDLLNHRATSNAVAEYYDVHHQSPQIIVIKAGKVVYHTSHHEVSADAIASHI